MGAPFFHPRGVGFGAGRDAGLSDAAGGGGASFGEALDPEGETDEAVGTSAWNGAIDTASTGASASAVGAETDTADEAFAPKRRASIVPFRPSTATTRAAAMSTLAATKPDFRRPGRGTGPLASE